MYAPHGDACASPAVNLLGRPSCRSPCPCFCPPRLQRYRLAAHNSAAAEKMRQGLAVLLDHLLPPLMDEEAAPLAGARGRRSAASGAVSGEGEGSSDGGSTGPSGGGQGSSAAAEPVSESIREERFNTFGRSAVHLRRLLSAAIACRARGCCRGLLTVLQVAWAVSLGTWRGGGGRQRWHSASSTRAQPPRAHVLPSIGGVGVNFGPDSLNPSSFRRCLGLTRPLGAAPQQTPRCWCRPPRTTCPPWCSACWRCRRRPARRCRPFLQTCEGGRG